MFCAKSSENVKYFSPGLDLSLIMRNRKHKIFPPNECPHDCSAATTRFAMAILVMAIQDLYWHANEGDLRNFMVEDDETAQTIPTSSRAKCSFVENDSNFLLCSINV